MSEDEVVRQLRTVALAKQVARGDFVAELDADGRLVRPESHLEMNPFCRRAVTHAVTLARATGGYSRVITMGPPQSVDVGREALACDVDRAYLLCDVRLRGSDCLVTARAIAAAIDATGPFDIVFAGQSAVDSNTSAVGPMVAELLQVPFVGPVKELGPVVESDGVLSVRALVLADGRRETWDVQLPAVLAVAERSTYPAKAPAEQWAAPAHVSRVQFDLLGPGPWGTSGSPTRVVRVETAPTDRSGTVLPDLEDASLDIVVDRLESLGVLGANQAPDTAGQASLPAIRRHHDGDVVAVVGEASDGSARALIGECAVVADALGARVVAVGPAARAVDFARWGADVLWVPSRWDPEGVARAIDVAGASLCRAVVGLTDSWTRQVVARLGVRLQGGLVSDATSIGVKGSHLFGTKPSGGRSTATIDAIRRPQLFTVQAGVLELRTSRPDTPRIPVRFLPVSGPERETRVDSTGEDDYGLLDRADVVVAVGRGVDIRHIPELEDLSCLLGAELGATRPVTDAGLMPHSRQIGVTARAVAPRVYVAVGVSGDQNHVSGFQRADLVIAINRDPDAPIFRHCDLGLLGDWRDVVRALSRHIRQHEQRVISNLSASAPT